MHGKTVKQVNNLKVNEVVNKASNSRYYEVYTLNGQLLYTTPSMQDAISRCSNCTLFLANKKPDNAITSEVFWNKILSSGFGTLSDNTTYVIYDEVNEGGSGDMWSKHGVKYIVNWVNKNDDDTSNDDIVLICKIIDASDSHNNNRQKILCSLIKNGEEAFINRLKYLMYVITNINNYHLEIDNIYKNIQELENKKSELNRQYRNVLGLFKDGSISEIKF